MRIEVKYPVGSRRSRNYCFIRCIECRRYFDIYKHKNQIVCSRLCRAMRSVHIRTTPARTKQWNKNIGNAQRGEKAYNWRGGITPQAKMERKDQRYGLWRKAVFERDNYTCQFCGQRGGELQADHIKPWAIYISLRFDVNNGRTLCLKCHKQTPTYGKNIRYLLQGEQYGY